MNKKVSVCVITYNHEKYIQQCLERILAQKCDFEYEIVIGEDCSTDTTLEIINSYRQKYPEVIRIISSAQNVGMVKNWERTLFACRGEYIAVIEGDDYWIWEEKLQKQVELLDNHKEFSLSFHDVGVIYGSDVPHIDYLTHITEGEKFTIDDLILKKWFIPTSSMLLRRDKLMPFPKWTKNLKAIDMVVQLMFAMQGDMGYIAVKAGVYRIHGGGISQMQWLGRENKFEFALIEILEYFNVYSKNKFSKLINLRVEESYLALMAKNSVYSFNYFKAIGGYVFVNPSKNWRVVKDWVILNIIPPRIYQFYVRIRR